MSAFDPATGPYQTERQALASPLCQEVRRLHDSGRVRSGDPDRLVRGAVLAALLEELSEAGVELGVYDRRVLEWLAGCEDTVVQVVVGLVRRAYAAGRGGRR